MVNTFSEKLQLLAQLTAAMELAVNELERSYENNDIERLNIAKRSILNFQKQISRLLEG